MSYETHHQKILEEIAGSIDFNIDEDSLHNVIETRVKEALHWRTAAQLVMDREKAEFIFHQNKLTVKYESEERYNNLNEYGDDKNNPAQVD